MKCVGVAEMYDIVFILPNRGPHRPGGKGKDVMPERITMQEMVANPTFR